MAAQEPHDYALLIGVQDYPRYPRFDTLSGPIDDVDGLERWLLDQDRGGGLDESHCKVIRSNSDPERPLHDDVDLDLTEIFQSAKENGGRRLYLYFSGHGLASDILGADLCLVRWSTQLRNYALSSTDYKKVAGESGLFAEIVFLLDCCRTTKIRARGRRSAIDWPKPSSGSASTRFFTAYATEYLNAAFEAETLPEGEPVPEVGEVRGYFTRTLLKALWGEAARPEGGVTATALKDYLELRVPQLAQADGKNQNPVVENQLPGGMAPTVFGCATRPELLTTITFSAARSGTIILEGPVGEIRRSDANTGPWILPMQAGALHVLLHEISGDQKSFRPTAGGGDVEF